MVTEVSSQPPASQPQQQQQVSAAQPHHQAQGGISANQSQPQGTRQYTSGPRQNRGRGNFNHNNNNGRVYNNDRNPQNYGGTGVKVHYNNNMNGGGGYQNQNRYPMPVRHYNNVAPNVTLAPNPSFTLSNQMIPTPAANHFSQNQFSAISNPPVFDEPGHTLLQNPGQNFESSQQLQPNQQLVPIRPQIQWSNGVQNGISVMDQPHINGIDMNGLGGENTIGNYQSQQMLQQQQPQQFPPAQTTYYGGYNQFGAGQTGFNPNMFFPNNNLNQMYGNNSAPNFVPGYGFGQPQFINPAGYSPYGAVNGAGNGNGQFSFICAVCKQQMQAGGDQATEIASTEKASSATESTQE